MKQLEAVLRTELVEDQGQHRSGFSPNKVKKARDIIPS